MGQEQLLRILEGQLTAGMST
jgi:hypothetical protein